MKTTQHTTGPWSVGITKHKDGPRKYSNAHAVFSPCGEPVAVVTPKAVVMRYDARDLANAQLIAASPDLLFALQMAEISVAGMVHAGSPIYGLSTHKGNVETLALIRAAISKAKGTP